jgi:hypothetical protein
VDDEGTAEVDGRGAQALAVKSSLSRSRGYEKEAKTFQPILERAFNRVPPVQLLVRQVRLYSAAGDHISARQPKEQKVGRLQTERSLHEGRGDEGSESR